VSFPINPCSHAGDDGKSLLDESDANFASPAAAVLGRIASADDADEGGMSLIFRKFGLSPIVEEGRRGGSFPEEARVFGIGRSPEVGVFLALLF
jgi:hypothetical protein